jgi:transient receptor potential cation channel subfamily A protein 1
LEKHTQDGYGTEQACIDIEIFTGIEKSTSVKVGQIGLLILALCHLLKEFVQVFQAQLGYFQNTENLIEWTTYVTSIIFAIEFNSCHSKTGLRHGWQWQLGAFAITCAWINLLANVRKFPFLGIYILMFTDVLKTFLKLSIVIMLFIIAFSLGFHCLLADQVSISYC